MKVLKVFVCQGCSERIERQAQRSGSEPKWCSERCRKRGYSGICEDCGARTCNGQATPPCKCRSCAPRARAAIEHEATVRRLVEQIRAWHDVYGEPPAVADWNPWQARHAYHDEVRAKRWEEGGWPWFTEVITHFGTWNAAIEAAGFDPREAHGGPENQKRKRRATAA